MIRFIINRLILITACLFSTIHPTQAQENQLLWKVSGKGLKSPSYLFGTFHILCDSSIASNPSLVKAMNNAKQLVVEADITNPSFLQEAQQKAVNPGMKNIYKEINPSDYALISQFLTKKYGAGLDQLGVLKPFSLLSMVTLGFVPCEKIFSLETQFIQKMKRNQFPVHGLETAAFQLELFDGIPLDIQIAEIVRLVQDEKGAEEFKAMATDYLGGNINKLYTESFKNDMMQTYQSLLLDDRNKRWIPQLEQHFGSASTFVAVGAAHLPGPLGVVELLRKKGYKVEPMGM